MCVLCDRRLTLSWMPGLYWYLYAIAHTLPISARTPLVEGKLLDRSDGRTASSGRHLVSFGTWVSQGAFANEGRDGGGELL